MCSVEDGLDALRVDVCCIIICGCPVTSRVRVDVE